MLRIATFNIRHGAQADGRVDHPALVRTCADLDADLLGLQEVDRGRLRSAFRDQAALVARRLGYEFVSGTVVRHGVVGRYGNALLARGGFSDIERVALVRPSRRQRRGAIVARVRLATADGERGGHPSAAPTAAAEGPASRSADPTARPARECSPIDRAPGSCSATSTSARRTPRPSSAAAGYHVTPASPTFPADRPRVTLDYIAVQGLRVVDSEVVPTHTSDHRAVVTTVDLA